MKRFLGLAAVLLLLWSVASGDASEMVRVEPKASKELLANPGMGWQTFHRFADEDKNLEGLPSGNAYFRFYWREIEPRNGEIDFAKFDQLLARARKAGQTLSVRVMCTGSGQYMDVPKWLKDEGCKGVEFNFEGRKHWVPDFEDPLFQKTHYRLIKELGRRYDGHPDLDVVDIGSVGLWGEWHMSGCKEVESGKAVAMPSVETRLAIIKAWCDAFPKTSKVMLIGSEEGMSRATAQGYGWRADCLGDMGGFSKNWNHMQHFYMQQLERTHALEAWKSAPVAYESCWDMRKWKEAGWDVDFIFDYALKTHASYMNNKSAPIPAGTRRQIEKFLMKLGYRLVLKSLEHEKAGTVGGNLGMTMEWENTGVAPPYRDEVLAIRLRSLALNKTTIRYTGVSIRNWLPGSKKMEISMPIPNSFSPGEYGLAVGVINPKTSEPAIKLGIEGIDADGWYRVSTVTVR